MAGLTKQQAISQFGSESYTGWDPASAQADFQAKQGGSSGGGGLSQQQSMQQFGTEAYTGWGATEAQADFSAKDLQAPVNVPLSSGGLSAEVERARAALDNELARQQSVNQEQLNIAKQRQEQGLEGFRQTAEGIREDIETFSEPITENILTDYEEYRKTTGRLEELLTEGQEYIRQQRDTTGLAAVRNPRVNRAMEDVAAEAGILQAKMSALQNGVAIGQSIINNKMNEIVTARQEELNYYNTIIGLAESNIVRLDEDSKRIAKSRINEAGTFLQNALDIQKTVQEYLADPTKAPYMQGVRLNMSIDQINQQITDNVHHEQIRQTNNEMAKSGFSPVADPGAVPSNRLVTITDARGNKYHYRKQVTGGGGFDTTGFVDELTQQGFKVEGEGLDTGAGVNVDSIWNEVLNQGSLGTYAGQPSFAPAGGIGTVWTDGAGTRWRYSANGWKKIGNQQ